MSIQPETLAWLRKTALDDNSYSQAMLYLLERVEALEADATEESQSRSFCNEAIVKRLEKLEGVENLRQQNDYVRGLEDRQRMARFRLLSIADELDPPNA